MAKVKEKVLRIKLKKDQEGAVTYAANIFNAAREASNLPRLSEDNFALEMLLQASLYLIKQYQQAKQLETEEAEANKVLTPEGEVINA